ncbi:MBL fold metallo-hydrolase [Galbibacter pacificus]|uniref:MBL fold metallo-hydrolase n=1 Tax=Galbibacter pacificus TaxID=2996052 RepID=A0ABT6FNQ4_9FLAO|nr:MBL fold metallo-hydrolase [Galbibacter pacificus]MDG3581216.1 MBL fold metallo-hydrolase [Galbibacter pacificus]MDG3584694.1 MBL fold metallo-hydrolase [Galbibacter pacificus]
MNIEQIYTGCLAQGAYYIESKGEVAIIDPLREVRPYIDKADAAGAKIKYIFETHFHADFVSGHVTLSERTGAPIIYGPTANPGFEAIIAKDGQEFKLGELTLIVLHTPGHTMESSTYLLKDKDGKDHALFTGDTLFLGDVGRPDLAQKAAHMTQEELAGTLYDSLRDKIMPLGDDIIIYPAHGAGSACGKNMMKETVDTLGNQKKVNYALRADMTKGEFVKEVIAGLQPPPAYFPMNVKMNKKGYRDMEKIIAHGENALAPDAFEIAANHTGAVLLDARHQVDFARGHVPGSIFIGIDGDFAPWVGTLIKDVQQPILLIAEKQRIVEVLTRLSRVGFDNTIGYLDGGFKAWKKAGRHYDTVVSIPADELLQLKQDSEHPVPVFDVRKPGEFRSAHILDAQNTPLSSINEHLNRFPEKEMFYIHCAGGYRSMIAASILKRRGIHNLIDIKGGFKAVKEAGIKTSGPICPASLK